MAGVFEQLVVGLSRQREPECPRPCEGARIFDRDDSPRPGATLEAVQSLKPVFRENGTVTAGNCCPLNDGAAALVVSLA